MFSRRDLITTGAVFTQARPAGAAAAQSRVDTDQIENRLEEIRSAIRDLRHLAASPAASQIRERQRAFLRQNQRYPEFIDVGIRIWEGMQDWHVENHQEMKITRSAEGRYLMEFQMTQLVLKPEVSDVEVGLAYDR